MGLAEWKYNIQLGQIVYLVQTNTIYSEEKFSIKKQQIHYQAITDAIST